MGWGCAILDPNGEPLGSIFGGLPGSRQAVPRGELWALIQLLQRTSGDLTVAVDAAYTTKGHSRGPAWAHQGNHDLWATYWATVGSRAGTVTLLKVKSHIRLEALPAAEAGRELAYRANQAADAAACAGALAAALPSHVCREVEQVDAKAWRVQKRLLACLLYTSDAADE